MAHDVFISYSTKDKTIADAVCAKLEEHKIRVWIAPRDVPAGSNFAESIIRAINTCKVFVLIWSANSNTSNHILNEINQAFDQGITIIPFRIQDIQPTDEMRYYFGRTHWLDAITPPLESHIAVLRDTILVNLDRELQPAKPALYSQESSGEGIQPTVKPSTEKEPAIERAEAVQPPLVPTRQEKSQKVDTEIRSAGTTPANLSRFIPFAAGGLVVVTLVVLLLSGVFKGSPSAGVAQTSLAPTSPIPPIDTIKPAETFTPIPSWMEEANALGEPILATINNQPPDFADDFSRTDSDWLYNLDECPDIGSTPMSVVDGAIQFTISPDCPFIGFTHPDFQVQSGDYVMQMDINFQQTNIAFEFGASSSNGFVVDFILEDDGWATFKQIPDSNKMQTVGNGSVQSEASKPVTLTIIKKGTVFLFYLNSELLTVYDIQAEVAYEHQTEFAVNNWSCRDTCNLETLLFDNIKVWDLDKIDY